VAGTARTRTLTGSRDHRSRLHFHYDVRTANGPRLTFTWYRIYVLQMCGIKLLIDPWKI